MNVTELARKLRINTQELRDSLPEMGFDIGQKAIKVDDRTAYRIMREWPIYRKRTEEKRRQEALEKEKEKVRAHNLNREVRLPSYITVRDFSKEIGMSVNQVITELMKNGVLASLNEKIDFDTAAIIGEELGLKIVRATENIDDVSSHDVLQQDRVKHILQSEKKEELIDRPPVVVIMGHVDHGKTKLLDAIRNTDVVSQETGGITQHIGAYQVEKNNQKISFIDTPGHEAFTAMRSRGARIADIAILVVAADDSIKPQTVEAIKIIEKAKLPMIVAINKIDKPDANVEKVKQDLSKMNLIPEEWGGKTLIVQISAKAGTNIEQLLDTILFVRDLQREHIKANPNRSAAGSVIESHIDKGEGPVATVLVQNGTLRPGDYLCIDQTLYGKVRSMKDWYGEDRIEAGPSMPVKVIGFKVAPKVGDVVEVTSDPKRLGKVSKKTGKSVGVVVTSQTHAKLGASDDDDESKKTKSVQLALKSDVLGSAEAIAESLEKIESDDVYIQIISKKLGNITEADVVNAEVNNAHLLGFNVSITPGAEILAKEKGVAVHIFGIIYELIDYMKEEMKKLLEEEMVETKIGSFEVLAIFKTETKSMIFGGKVLEGKVEPYTNVKVYRAGEFVISGKITQLQSGRQDVSDVLKGQECGMSFSGKPLVEVGDRVDVYREELITKTIE